MVAQLLLLQIPCFLTWRQTKQSPLPSHLLLRRACKPFRCPDRPGLRSGQAQTASALIRPLLMCFAPPSVH